MAQPLLNHSPEDDGPGSRPFTAGLLAAFRTQARAEVERARAEGVPVAGIDRTGRRVEPTPRADEAPGRAPLRHERAHERG